MKKSLTWLIYVKLVFQKWVELVLKIGLGKGTALAVPSAPPINGGFSRCS
jgi:hypothetical protein